MVDIQSPTKLRFFNHAEAAFLAITLPCFAGLPDPVGAIIERMPPHPGGVILSVPMLGLPRGKTGDVAERQAAIRPRPRGTRHGISAVIAQPALTPIPSRRLLADESPDEGGSHAIPGAVLGLPTIKPVGRTSIKGTFAVIADDVISRPRASADAHRPIALADLMVPPFCVGPTLFGILVRHYDISSCLLFFAVRPFSFGLPVASVSRSIAKITTSLWLKPIRSAKEAICFLVNAGKRQLNCSRAAGIDASISDGLVAGLAEPARIAGGNDPVAIVVAHDDQSNHVNGRSSRPLRILKASVPGHHVYVDTKSLDLRKHGSDPLVVALTQQPKYSKTAIHNQGVAAGFLKDEYHAAAIDNLGRAIRLRDANTQPLFAFEGVAS